MPEKSLLKLIRKNYMKSQTHYLSSPNSTFIQAHQVKPYLQGFHMPLISDTCLSMQKLSFIISLISR